MPQATVSSKGQVVIPQAIRKEMGIRAGDRVDFQRHGDHLHVVRVGDPVEAFLSGPKQHVQPGDVERALQDRF